MHAIFPLFHWLNWFNLQRRTQWLVGVMLLLHLALGASLGLSVDEAHYALYAARPDWSYFDHPPLVGWVQLPLVALHAPVWMLRLLPELLWLGSALLAHALAERLAPPTLRQGCAGFWTLMALALAPLFHVLGIGLLPDTLLMFFTLLTMRVTLELMQLSPSAPLKNLPLWITLGIALGLAGLSKYTAIFAALAVALCLFSAHGWRIVQQMGLWLALVIALLLVVPVAYWNYTHDWISFRYQVAHGSGGGWQGLHFLRFLVVQIVVYGALLFWGWKGTAPAHRALLAFFAIPFAVLAYLSGGGTSLPHWTAPAWMALLPFAGIGLATALKQGRYRLIATFATLQTGLTLVLITLLLTGGFPIITHTQGEGNDKAPSNPFADVYGWEEAGIRARTLAAQQNVSKIAVQNWTLASRIAWYARPLPVHVLNGGLADGLDQFTLWWGKLPAGSSALLVQWSQLLSPEPLPFAQCQLLETQTVTRLGHPLSEFRFYACHDYRP